MSEKQFKPSDAIQDWTCAECGAPVGEYLQHVESEVYQALEAENRELRKLLPIAEAYEQILRSPKPALRAHCIIHNYFVPDCLDCKLSASEPGAEGEAKT